MNKKRFFKSAFMLTFINMIVQVSQTYLEIYCSKKLGSEGVGIFQIMMSVFGLAVTLGAGGYSIAVTRLSAKKMHLSGRASARRAVKKAVFTALITGFISAFAVIIFSEKICRYCVKDIRMIFPLEIFAFTIPLTAASLCINAYYISFDKIGTLGFISIMTETVHIILLILFMNIIGFTFTGKCCAIAFSSVFAEISGLILNLIFFAVPSGLGEKSVKTEMKEVLTISMPVGISASLRSFLNMIQNMLIPWGLLKFGLSQTDAMSAYGMIRGMAIPVVVFPAAFMSAFLTMLIPEISRAYESGDKAGIGRAVTKASSVTVIFSIALTGIYIIYGDELGRIIYENECVGRYIKILAPLTAFMFLDDVVDSVLKGMNEQMKSLQFNIIESASRVILLFIAVPKTGIVGYVFVIFFGNILNFCLSYGRLSHVAPVFIDIVNWIIKPSVILCLSGFAVKLMFLRTNISIISVMLSVTVYLLIYFTLCIKSGCLRDIL